MDKQGKFLGDAMSFDDVLLVPGYSEVLPKNVNISTLIGNGLKLSIPIVSAAMDTVTESRMAIAMAREGGLGIVHRNMSIKRQAQEVDRVKRSEHGVISDPFYLSPDKTVEDALKLMAQYHISGFL